MIDAAAALGIWLGARSGTLLFDLSPALVYPLIALFVIAALVFLLGGAIAFRLARTTVNPLQPAAASTLVTGGIYRFSRNPMYVGMGLLLIAWGIYCQTWWTAIFVIACILYLQRFQIQPEEKALALKFGKAFEEYKSRVRPWL